MIKLFLKKIKSTFKKIKLSLKPCIECMYRMLDIARDIIYYVIFPNKVNYFTTCLFYKYILIYKSCCVLQFYMNKNIGNNLNKDFKQWNLLDSDIGHNVLSTKT